MFRNVLSLCVMLLRAEHQRQSLDGFGVHGAGVRESPAGAADVRTREGANEHKGGPRNNSTMGCTSSAGHWMRFARFKHTWLRSPCKRTCGRPAVE